MSDATSLSTETSLTEAVVAADFGVVSWVLAIGCPKMTQLWKCVYQNNGSMNIKQVKKHAIVQRILYLTFELGKDTSSCFVHHELFQQSHLIKN